jgi:hypothetical protein
MKIITRSLSLVALLAIGSVANADTLMDQITGGTIIGATPFGVDQVFTDLSFTTFSGLVIDDFTTVAGYQLTNASVLLEGSYNPTDFQVSIWSSIADAASSGDTLNGNTVVQQLVPVANVTTTSIGSPNGSPAVRLDIPINLNLNAGTYYLGIAPVQDFTNNGQLFILANSAANPGGNNAVFINPGNGFGMGTSGQQAFNASLMLQGNLISAAVPEPGSVALLIGMATVGGIAVRRRKK